MIMMWKAYLLPNFMNKIYYLNDLLHDLNLVFLVFLLSLVTFMSLVVATLHGFKAHIGEVESLEIVWTLVPCLILLFLGWPSLYLLYSAEDYSSFSSLTLKAVGHQWYWSYDYSDFEEMEFDSFIIDQSDLKEGDFLFLEVDSRAFLPFSCLVRLLISSADVLHAFAVPSMSLKVDANPGRLSQIFVFSMAPGIFYGQCSELCGANHSFMPIVVEFTSMSLFLEWVYSKMM